MRRAKPSCSRGDQGFTLIELMVVVLIISLTTALAVPVFRDSIRRARTSALTADAKVLYDSMMFYYSDNNAFPPDDSFDVASLDPLASEGYLHSGVGITSKLAGRELLIYLAPDVGGTDQQFIIVMRHADDSNIIAAAVHTNLVTEDGDWLDGVYIIDDEDLEDAGDALDPPESLPATPLAAS